MTIAPLAISTVAATSAATVTLAAVGDRLDTATITIIGTVACGIIASLSVAIVKILGALQELKVAVIKAAEDRSKASEKVAENSAKLHAIGESTDGNLSAMRKQLDEATRRIDEMQKAAVTAAESRAAVSAPVPGAVPGVPPMGSPGTPVEMLIVNPEHDPAKVVNVEPKPNP